LPRKIRVAYTCARTVFALSLIMGTASAVSLRDLVVGLCLMHSVVSWSGKTCRVDVALPLSGKDNRLLSLFPRQLHGVTVCLGYHSAACSLRWACVVMMGALGSKWLRFILFVCKTCSILLILILCACRRRIPGQLNDVIQTCLRTTHAGCHFEHKIGYNSTSI